VRSLTPHDIAQFRTQGFLVVRGFFSDTPYLDDVEAEITALGRVYDRRFLLDTAIDHIRAFSAPSRKRFYNGLRYLAALNRLGSSARLVALSQQLGQRVPAVMRAYNIRMDLPIEADFLFHWHQDIVYTLGSLNSLTYWVPFNPVGRDTGSVELIPGSHARGVFPVRYAPGGTPTMHRIMSPKDLYLLHEPLDSGSIIEAERGDLVVFSTFLLHRSVANRGDRVRWTAQIRHSDMAEAEFVESGYLWGDVTNYFHAPYLLQRTAPRT
jgi:hypothetical protein